MNPTIKKVGILGGAFDPVHIDHLNTAKAVLDAGLVDYVSLMPCYNHRFGKQPAPSHDRYRMLNVAIHDFGETRIHANPQEMERRHDGGTYDLLKSIAPFWKEKWGWEISYITGLDNANIITKWASWEKLIAEFPFIVVRRKNCVEPKPDAWYLQAPHFYLDVDEKIGDNSSTRIRDQIEKGNVPTGLTPSVAQYIRDNKLYKPLPY